MAQTVYDRRRPRLPLLLAQEIDRVRGQVPFNLWVVRALEAALGGEEDQPHKPVDVRATAPPVVPSASPRAPKASPKDRGLMTPGEAQVIVDQAIAPPEVQARPFAPPKRDEAREWAMEKQRRLNEAKYGR